MIRRLSLPLLVIALIAVLAGAGSAAALVRELPLNVKVKGSIELDGGVDDYVFDAVPDLQITVTLSGGSKNVLPVLEIIDPLGESVLIPAPSSSGKTKLKKHMIETGGRHRLRIIVTQAGSYTLKLKTTAPRITATVAVPAGSTGGMTFGCLAGATVKITGSEGVKKGPDPEFVSLTDPDDATVTPGSNPKSTSKGFKVGSTTITEKGIHRVTVSLEGGVEGTATVRVDRSDPPKSGTIDEADLLAGQVEKVRLRGPAAEDEGFAFLAAALDTGSIEAIVLEIPGRDDRELGRNFATGQFELTESFDDQASLDADFPDGTYVLRIQREGVDVDEELTFVIGGDFPDDAFSTGPVDLADGVSLTPTISWNAVAGAAEYEAVIQREGSNLELFSFVSETPAETSVQVPASILIDGPVYRLTLVVHTENLKGTYRTTRFSTASEDEFGFSNPVVEKRLTIRPGVTFGTGEDDLNFSFVSTFTGAGVVAAQLEYVATGFSLPVAAFTPVPGTATHEMLLRWDLPRGYGWLNSVNYSYTLIPDGEYQIHLLYLDGTEELSEAIEVGGRAHEFGSMTGPKDGEPVNVLTPTWMVRQDEDSGDYLERTWRFVVDEPATGEVVYETEHVLTRVDAYENFVLDPLTIPDGVLEKKREYRLTWISTNHEGWAMHRWSTFSTGSDQNKPSFASVGKEHRRDGVGDEKFVFLAEVAGVTLKRARIRNPQGNLLSLREQSDGFFRLKVSFDSDEDLGQALPDGKYTFDLEYDDGTPNQLREFEIGGTYPVLPVITTPTHGEKKVAKDPGVAWSYDPDDADQTQGFYVRISEVKSGFITYQANLQRTVRDTKVPSTRMLRGGKKHELNVYALGSTRKNALEALEFKTK